MIVRYLYWILVALLLRLVWRSLWRGALAPSQGGGGRASAVPTVYKGVMVRDPVCGLYLPESRALVEVEGGERIHFCSESCRASFRSSRT